MELEKIYSLFYINSDNKAAFLEDMKDAMNELKLVKEGKLTGVSTKELLAEL